MQAKSIVEVKQLSIKGHKFFNLDINEFNVFEGETLAIVGANGSGKSTLIEGVLDFRKRKSGDVKLLQKSWPSADSQFQIRKSLGVQLQNIAYPENFKVKELISLHETMYTTFSRTVHDAFEISEIVGLVYGNLSKGQKQRVDLFMAMAHLPVLLILDEPSSGLDKHFQSKLLKLLKHRQTLNLTTIICSHTDLEVEICDRIICMEDGGIVQDFTGDILVHNLKKFGTHKVVLKKSSNWRPEFATEILDQKEIRFLLDDDSEYLSLFGNESISENGIDCIKKGLGTGMELEETSTNDVLRILIHSHKNNLHSNHNNNKQH